MEQITRTALVEDLGEQIEALQDARDEAVRVLRAALSRPDPPRSWLADHIARAIDELGSQP